MYLVTLKATMECKIMSRTELLEANKRDEVFGYKKVA